MKRILFNKYQNEVDVAIEAAKQAGYAVMEIYRTKKCSYTVKEDDHSPVTEADHVSNEIICQILARNFEYHIVSEEGRVKSGYGMTEKNWLIDPLDGTKEFLAGNSEFTINISLINDHRPVVGVIACPCKNEVYYAVDGCGAYCMRRDQNIYLRKLNNLVPDNLKIMISRSDTDWGMNKIFKKLDKYDVIKCGSSLKYCAVASGSASAAIRSIPLYEWDIAAANCILLECGAAVTDLSGESFVYNNENPLMTSGVIVANKSLHLRLVKLLQ